MEQQQITKNEIIHVALKDLYPSNNNVRGFMDESNIVDLMNSIAQVGLLTPLIVQELDDVEGGFVVVAGHRRLEALTRLHSDDWLVPVLVRNDFDDCAVTQVMYEVRNTLDRPVTGQAVPSYGPQRAGQYFKKLECFCFQQQTLGPHETRLMPVVFVIDPQLPEDLGTITLSYTFFEVAGTQKRPG